MCVSMGYVPGYMCVNIGYVSGYKCVNMYTTIWYTVALVF